MHSCQPPFLSRINLGDLISNAFLSTSLPLPSQLRSSQYIFVNYSQLSSSYKHNKFFSVSPRNSAVLINVTVLIKFVLHTKKCSTYSRKIFWLKNSCVYCGPKLLELCPFHLMCYHPNHTRWYTSTTFLFIHESCTLQFHDLAYFQTLLLTCC